jgi:hypothetical protein
MLFASAGSRNVVFLSFVMANYFFIMVGMAREKCLTSDK